MADAKGVSKDQLKAQAERVEARPDAGAEKPNAPTVARPLRNYRALVFQGYVLTAAAAFAVLAFLAHTVLYFPFDITITLSVQAFHAFWFDDLMRYLSTLGYAPQVWAFAGLIVLWLYVAGLRWEAVMSVFAAVGVSVLGAIVKLVVGRPRPTANLVHVFAQLRDLSFPSGHVLMAVGFVGFIWFLVYSLFRHSWQRTLALYVLGTIVALMGLSRIYLGQHWASDVLGAYLLGSLWLALTIYVYRWGKPRYFVNQPIAAESPQRRPS